LEQRLKEIREHRGQSKTQAWKDTSRATHRGTLSDLDSLTFPLILDRYLTEISPTKCQGGRNDKVYSIMPRKFFLNDLVSDIKPRRVYQYIEWRKGVVSDRLDRPVSGATINREIALIKHLLNQCVYWGLIESSPLPYKSIDRKGIPKEVPRERYITDEEYQKLLICLGGRPRQIVETCYYTGQRTGRIFSLQWKQIDFGASTISFERSKHNKRVPSSIPIPHELVSTLLGLFNERKTKAVISPWVFCHHDGSQIKSIRKAWTNACKKAGIQDADLRDLRAKRVTDLQRQGVQQKVVMQLTGHSTVSIHERYNRPGIEDLREALDRKAGEK
jgi:integrase